MCYLFTLAHSTICLTLRLIILLNTHFIKNEFILTYKEMFLACFNLQSLLEPNFTQLNNKITYLKFILEILFEFFLIFTIFYSLCIKPDLADRDEFVVVTETVIENNDIEIYLNYKAFKSTKKFLFILQLVLFSYLIIVNVTILNLPILLIFMLNLLFTVLYPTQYYHMDILNRLYNTYVFINLTTHYISNIQIFKSQTFNNFIGIINLESRFSNIYLVVLIISYLNSSYLSSFNFDTKIVKNTINTKILKQECQESFIVESTIKKIEIYFYKFASFIYKFVILLWILRDVCCLMFFNFVILYCGLSQLKQKFQKFYLLSTFILCLKFFTFQFVYNLRGFFIKNSAYSNYLEILGVNKINKDEVQNKFTDLAYLDEMDYNKLMGLFPDLATLLILFFCAVALRKENFREQRQIVKSIINCENLPENNQTRSSLSLMRNSWLDLILQKSYIFSLFFIFIASTIKFDAIHLIYFILFNLMIVLNENHFIFLWNKAMFAVCLLIVIIIYFWNILAINFLGLMNETDPLNRNIFTYLGFKINQKNIFFIEYWEHICLYLFAYIQHFLISENYQKNRQQFSNNFSSEIFKLPKATKPLVVGLIFLFMFILSNVKPYSYFGLGYLIIGFAFLLNNLFILTSVKNIINRWLSCLILIFSLIVVIIKYSVGFGIMAIFSDRVKQFNNPNNFFNVSDFDLNKSSLMIKVYLVSIILMLVKILNSYSNVDAKTNKPFSSEFFTYIKVFLYQLLYLHGNKIAILANALICFYLESFIGLLMYSAILICLYLELKSYWKYYFIPVSALSYLIICLLYICRLNFIKSWMDRDYEWLGLYSPKNEGFFTASMPFLLIILFSYISRISSNYVMFYKQDEEDSNKQNFKPIEVIMENSIESDQSISRRKSFEYNPQLNDESKDDSIREIRNRSINIKRIQRVSVAFVKVGEGAIVDCTAEEYEIITKLSAFWNLINYICYLYGFYFVLVIIMLISFIKVNLISIILLTFVLLNSLGIYMRTGFHTAQEDEKHKNLKTIKRIWFYFSIFLTIYSLCQYFNFIWLPPSWKITMPWKNVSFSCSRDGQSIYSFHQFYSDKSDYEYCVTDWITWLDFDYFTSRDMFLNFLALFVILLSIDNFKDEKRFERPIFIYSNEADFTLFKDKRTIYDITKYFLFIHLKFIILFFITIISIIYAFRFTSLIFAGYLFIAFYLFFKGGSLNKHKNNLWKYLQYYNYSILFIIMLFQTPLLPCPVNRDGRVYMGLGECIEEENKLFNSFILYNYPKDKVDAIYMLIVQTVGLLKLDFDFLILNNLFLFMIYILALIQEIIFNHPYQAIVDRYYEREKSVNWKSRAFKIVQDFHLNTYKSYRMIFNYSEVIMKKKLERLEHMFSDIETDIEKGRIINNNEEKVDIITEQLISDNPLYGLVDNSRFREKVKEITERIALSMRNENEEGRTEDNLNQDERTCLLAVNRGNRREKAEWLFKIQLDEEIKKEYKKLLFEQKLKDMEILFKQDDHGLNIANEYFQKYKSSNNENINLDSMDIELKLFQDMFHCNDINQELKPKQLEIPTYYNDIKKALKKGLDSSLLLDLNSPNKLRINDLFEIILYLIYSNIEKVIFLAFILNICTDASIMSLIYPVSYLGYGLLEYPFTNKQYWRTLLVYSLLVITIKILYQLPFFCGYPFYSVFNIFRDNYCEYYTVTEQQITLSIDYLIGLRKYNGEYSYPKNMGLFSGIFLDLIIMTLLLIQRSLLKSKGIWSFIRINNEFTKVPTFEEDKKKIIPNDSNIFYTFIKRLIPELFGEGRNLFYKPGKNLYPLSFASLLLILFYSICFFGKMTGKFNESITDLLDRQQFSKGLIWTVIILISILVIDRIIYKWRSVKIDFLKEMFKNEIASVALHEGLESAISQNQINTSNKAVMFKLILHYLLMLLIHVLVFIIIPQNTKVCFINNPALIVFYILCVIYFYISALQIKHGYPLITKGQVQANKTKLYHKILFKLYKVIPFLHELRVILDWTITKTSLDMVQWFKMEDAYSTLNEVKFEMWNRKMKKLGQERTVLEKYIGLAVFTLLMLIVILPMILFSGFNPNLVENNIQAGRFSINLEIKDPETKATVFLLNLFENSSLKINQLKQNDQYQYFKNFLITNIDDLEQRMVQKIRVVNFSQKDWTLSPPTINALLKLLDRKADAFLYFDWEFKRDHPHNYKNMIGNKKVKLDYEQIDIFKNLISALKNNQKLDTFKLHIKGIFKLI
jgi:hypothetical protein